MTLYKYKTKHDRATISIAWMRHLCVNIERNSTEFAQILIARHETARGSPRRPLRQVHPEGAEALHLSEIDSDNSKSDAFAPPTSNWSKKSSISQKTWWSRRDLNPRPLRCERSALPAELLPHSSTAPAVGNENSLATA